MTEDIIPHSWKTDVNCIVYVDNMLITNHYNFEVGFDTSSTNPVLHDIAFEKVQMFFEVIMPNSVIMSSEEYEQKTLTTENNVIETPEFLNDQTIGCLVYSKLTSLVGGDMIIEYIKIMSNLGKGITYTINQNSPELHILLPSKNDWWGDADIKHLPWWLRNDSATHDEILEGNTLYSGEVNWDEYFESELEEASNIELQSDAKNKFKIISGGKDETKPSK